MLTESWEGFVQRDCLYGCHRHLLRGLKDLVGFLEYLLIGGGVEGPITYVCPHVYGQLEGPNGQSRAGTAAADQLLGFATDIVHDLVSKL